MQLQKLISLGFRRSSIGILLLLLALVFSSCGQFAAQQGNAPQPVTTPATFNSSTSASHPSAVTSAVPSTQTGCPATGKARAAVMAPLALSSHQTIVYAMNTGPFDAFDGAGLGVLKRYDAATSLILDIVSVAHRGIEHPQVSADGQWVLFVTRYQDSAHLDSETVQLIRLDGQGLQTLYCPAEGDTITSMQWSPDQKSLVFSEQLISASLHSPTTLYFLNMLTGQLQIEVAAPNNYNTPVVGYTPVAWLDNTHIYVTDTSEQGRYQNLYLLDIAQPPDQQHSNLQKVASIAQPCWDFDSSPDGSKLYLSTCVPGSGPSSITVQSATGGSQRTIYHSPVQTITAVRAISNTNLLLLIENASGNRSDNGLWEISADGSHRFRILEDSSSSLQLNQSSQYTWSNISRDGTLYALQKTSPSGKADALIFGSLTGRFGKVISTGEGTELAIASWTMM